MMTKETLDKLQALLAEATPGPWRVAKNTHGLIDECSSVHAGSTVALTFRAGNADAALIAAAVNALPELLDTIDAQREEIDDMVRAFCRAAGVERDDHGQAVERVTKMRADIDAQRGQLDAIEDAIIGHDDEDMKHPKCTVAELVKRVLVERDAQREEIAELEAENAALYSMVDGLLSEAWAPPASCLAERLARANRLAERHEPVPQEMVDLILAKLDALRKEGK